MWIDPAFPRLELATFAVIAQLSHAEIAPLITSPESFMTTAASYRTNAAQQRGQAEEVNRQN